MGTEQAAQEFLAGLDDPIATLARDHGRVEASLPSSDVPLSDHLSRLTLSIVGQQISVIAALAIFGRLRELLGGMIDAEALEAAHEDELRAVGLSRAKARAIHELGTAVPRSARAVAAVSRPRLRARDLYEDPAVLQELSRTVSALGAATRNAALALLLPTRRRIRRAAGDLRRARASATA